MYLKEGCSLLLKVHKPSIPFIFNTNPILNPSLNNELNANPTIVNESDVLRRLRHENDLALALEYFKSIANSKYFKHTPLTYPTMIEKLGHRCEMDGIQYLLQQMKLEGVSCLEDLFIM